MKRTAILLALLSLLWGAGPADAAPRFAVFVGSGNEAKVRQFEAFVPRPVERVVDFGAAYAWSGIEAPSWVRKYGNRKLTLSVPLFPFGGTLAACAAGSYDFHYTALARNLVAWGQEDAVLRPGWEFNSKSWFNWRTNGTAQGNASFAGCFRRFVHATRPISSAFKFEWSVVNRGLDPRPAWPGDSYVDYVGIDVYDQTWAPNYWDKYARWNDVNNGAYGLAFLGGFTYAHGKKVSLPEWGLTKRDDGHGGGDSPYFIERMHAWIGSNAVAYHAYFEADASDGRHALMNWQFPNAAQRFRELFGR